MEKRTVGERLAMYVGDGSDKTMSISSFAKAMRLRTPRPNGSSRAMVHRYLAGTEPPSDFIVAAAEMLGLNVEWLAFEIGHPTPAHAEAAAVSSGAAPQAVDWTRERAGRLMHTILQFMHVPQPGGEDIPYWRSPESNIPHWVAPLGEVRLRLVVGGSYNVHDSLGLPGAIPGSSYIDRYIERDIAAALNGPLEALRIDPAKMDPDTLADYITAMLLPLLAIAAERRKQQPDSKMFDDPKMRMHEVTRRRSKAPAKKSRGKPAEATPAQSKKKTRASSKRRK
jgi:hypothetical protein